MKKLLLILFILILPQIHTYAEEIKTVPLTFSTDQFTFIKDSSDVLTITSNSMSCYYGPDVTEPGLPFVPINIRIANGYKFVKENGMPNFSLFFSGANMAANPTSVTTNSTDDSYHAGIVTYKRSIYPESNVKYIGTSHIDGYTILRFLVCPFSYNTINKNLYFSRNIAISISLDKSGNTNSDDSGIFTGENMCNLVDGIIVNADEYRSNSISPLEILPARKNKLDYVIITSSDLYKDFEVLATWKTMKGIRSRVLTIEEIKKAFPETTTQLAIKNYIYYLYKTQGLKYVLLGGDDNIVPVLGCYGKVNGIVDETIPTDLFYACFGKNFSWDANGNGIYGELSDSISIDPSVFVTRLPVRTNEDTKNAVNRIIKYEKDPTYYAWNDNMLSAGNKLTWIDESIPRSDAENKGDFIYKNYIEPYRYLKREKFYDTFSTLNGNTEYRLNSQNLQSQLQKGYTFFDMISHGGAYAWGLKYGLYGISDAESLVNPRYTVITTNACETNAFDSYVDSEGNSYEPCLSEAFIRNPNSGIVAYLGSSRYGWTNRSKELGASLQYEAMFYKTLFDPSSKEKSFGYAVAVAKQIMANSCNWYNTYRWIQFSLNPIGDPEMPIYTSTPKTLSFVKIQKKGNSLVVNTGNIICNICVSSIVDNGKTYYERRNDVTNAVFTEINSLVSVCVTKQDYIPVVETYNFQISENCITSCSQRNTDGTFVISTKLCENVKDATVVISDINGNKEKTYHISSECPNTTDNYSCLNKGIHHASLYIEGELMDTRSFTIR